MNEAINRFMEEVAEYIGSDVDKVRVALDMSQATASLDVPVGEDDDATIGDLQPDNNAVNPYHNLVAEANKDIINSVFDTLGEREANILKLRFGIDTDHHTHLRKWVKSLALHVSECASWK